MATPELLEWCGKHGVRVQGIAASSVDEGGRGLVAVEDLPPGACLLRVPRKLLMSVESARRDPQLAAVLQQCGQGLTSEEILAAHLLHECSKGNASFWHPYLRSLPRSYTTAMCFSDTEAAALQVPAAVAAARAAVADAEAQHVGALPLLRALQLGPNWRSRAAWLWAASSLSSRTMYLPFDSAGALTPLGDFANYRPPPPPVVPSLPDLLAAAAALSSAADGAAAAAGAAGLAGSDTAPAAEHLAAFNLDAQGGGSQAVAGDGSLDEQADEYCLYARIGYKAGEQVFLCYGRHTNLGLLQHYGFVLGDNPHDVAALPPRLLPPAVQQQLASSSSGGGGSGAAAEPPGWEAEGATSPALLHANGAPSWELLRALRLGCTTSAERKTSAYLALADRPISAASERAAFEGLRGACQAALAKLPTTTEQDERELETAAAAATAAAATGQDTQTAAGVAAATGQDNQAAAAAAATEQHNQTAASGQAEGAPAAGAEAATAEEQRRRQQQQAAAERLRIAVEWRLCYKRILRRCMALCDAVLAALPQVAQAPAADIGGRIAVLRRQPRW